jgi:hypothetical protein
VFLLGLVSCKELPTQEEMRKTVKYGSDVKFCNDTEGVDVLLLTDSDGLNIRKYYMLWKWNKDSINNFYRTESFDYYPNAGRFHSGPGTGILGCCDKGQNTRLYSESKPFTGRAKLCVDSIKVEALYYPSRETYWIKKKAVVLEEMNVVDGWLDGEFIQYQYELDNDWKNVVLAHTKKTTFKKGYKHGSYLYNVKGTNIHRGNYKNGLKEGFWIESYKGEYLNGNRIGVWTQKRNYEGKEYVDKINYENGEKVESTTYLNERK